MGLLTLPRTAFCGFRTTLCGFRILAMEHNWAWNFASTLGLGIPKKKKKKGGAQLSPFILAMAER